VSAALVGAIAGLVGSIPAILISLRTQKFAEKQYEDATRVDRQVRERVEEMLSHAEWESRSFQAIAGTLRGLPHDDIRRALIAGGAVSFDSEDGKEMWTNRMLRKAAAQRIYPSATG